MKKTVLIILSILVLACDLNFISDIAGTWKCVNVDESHYLLQIINDESLEENFTLTKYKGEEVVTKESGKVDIVEGLLYFSFAKTNDKRVFKTDLSINQLELINVEKDSEFMVFKKIKEKKGENK